MPSTVSPSSTVVTNHSISFVSSTRSAASCGSSRQARFSVSWLRVATVVAVLAIAVQVLAMAQLAQHQVERGVQLRQALAAEKAESANGLRTHSDMQFKAVSLGQGERDSQAAYARY